MRLTLLGSGNAGGVPLYGCRCAACERARRDPRFIRRPATALVEGGGTRLLIDAGLVDLVARFEAGSLNAILLTHFHVDHVQGLFPLRWGQVEAVPVWSPPDPEGCADLYKHPGILDFHHPEPFVPLTIGALTVTAVPLRHSKMTYGYCLQTGSTKLAYLTDTVGLPPATRDFLQGWHPDGIVLDCCHPPQEEPPRNHNDVCTALESADAIGANRVIITHISHELDLWLMEGKEEFPSHIHVGHDGLVLSAIRRDMGVSA
ncbi:phosphonate metabolism protein PhnP [Pelobacter sp. M08fum]|uniref:Phosphonate metabolism protein PhnP n=1 Tax=Pelovirga terrestris TaxID=2771352 RepID=A0A8J6QLV2_9BACT|nr:phosphonate metabolism protein PhnP [Pelovirga terrestris]